MPITIFYCSCCNKKCKNTCSDDGQIEQDVFCCEYCRKVFCKECEHDNFFHQDSIDPVHYDFGCCIHCCNDCFHVVCVICNDIVSNTICEETNKGWKCDICI